ncbi:MAG: biopolymer transporter Tol, partial [Bacteroidota bacterium]
YTSTGDKIALLKQEDRKEMPAIVASVNEGSNSDEHTLSSNKTASPSIAAREYRNVYTSLSLIPMVRIDNYNPRNKGLDIVKPGLYFSSTDVVGKLSLFGGAAVNRKFERDLFFIFEYRDKVPGMYQAGLDPVLSFEVYNITRQTSNNLDLTPYIVETDVTYNLLEFDLFLRQKILTEFTELKFGYTLSRYSADIGSFVNPNDNVLYPSFRSTYLIASVFSAQVKHDAIMPSGESEINPAGRTVTLRYALELNRFNPDGEFEIRNGFLEPLFRHYDFHRVELFWNEYLALPFDRHTLSLSLRGGSILGGQVDNFFDFYAGGFTGMRGYPFYALGGNEYATVNIGYRFPIWRSIDVRLLQFYFKKLYGVVYGDVGMAWNGSAPPLSQWKSDAGFELRLESFSFYAYPTRIFFSGAYGFDQFTRTINNIGVTYGREWRFYFGVLFGFELSQAGKVF